MGAETSDGRIPVTVITGFLGAGKTTLLNRILGQAGRGKRLAVIENEFGEVSIDDELIEGVQEDLVELAGGCVCCSLRGDLISAFEALMKREPPVERVLIETTGLADPGPVAQVFLMNHPLRERFRLDAIVSVVDAKQIRDGDTDYGQSQSQIAMADVLVLNKIDLIPAESVDGVEAWLKGLNPAAPVYRTTRAEIPLEHVVDVGGIDVARVVREDFVHVSALGDPEAGHLDEITSVGLRVEGDVDPERFTDWIAKVLVDSGPDILRVKGILSFAGNPKRSIFEAVRMLSEMRDGRAWGDQARSSRIVFIGKRLDGDALRAAFESCLA